MMFVFLDFDFSSDFFFLTRVVLGFRKNRGYWIQTRSFRLKTMKIPTDLGVFAMRATIFYL
jgi:hypothetical protein